jgi:DnaJ-domain-containing protein 1
MNLPGRLQATTLGDLLGKLHRAQISGILELLEPGALGRAHRVFFDRGLVDNVETSMPGPRLGEVLSNEGVLSRDDLLCLSRRLITEPHKTSGQILAELINESAVISGLRRQLRLRLEGLFQLSEALIRFHVRPLRREPGNVAAPLHPTDFLRGRPRAREQKRATGRGAFEGAKPERPELARKALSVLGLTPGDDAASIQRAFRRLAAESHPDRHPEASAEERARLLRRFAELSGAYHTLVG